MLIGFFLCHSGSRLCYSFCFFKLIWLPIVCDTLIFFKLWLFKFFLSQLHFLAFFGYHTYSIAVFVLLPLFRLVFHPLLSSYAFMNNSGAHLCCSHCHNFLFHYLFLFYLNSSHFQLLICLHCIAGVCICM